MRGSARKRPSRIAQTYAHTFARRKIPVQEARLHQVPIQVATCFLACTRFFHFSSIITHLPSPPSPLRPVHRRSRSRNTRCCELGTREGFVRIIAHFFTSSFHGDLDQSADPARKSPSLFNCSLARTLLELSSNVGRNCAIDLPLMKHSSLSISFSYFAATFFASKALLVRSFQKCSRPAISLGALSRMGKRLSRIYLDPSRGSIGASVQFVGFIRARIGKNLRIGVRTLSDGLIMSVSVLVGGRSRRFSHAHHEARARGSRNAERIEFAFKNEERKRSRVIFVMPGRSSHESCFVLVELLSVRTDVFTLANVEDKIAERISRNFHCESPCNFRNFQHTHTH